MGTRDNIDFSGWVHLKHRIENCKEVLLFGQLSLFDGCKSTTTNATVHVKEVGEPIDLIAAWPGERTRPLRALASMRRSFSCSFSLAQKDTRPPRWTSVRSCVKCRNVPGAAIGCLLSGVKGVPNSSLSTSKAHCADPQLDCQSVSEASSK